MTHITIPSLSCSSGRHSVSLSEIDLQLQLVTTVVRLPLDSDRTIPPSISDNIFLILAKGVVLVTRRPQLYAISPPCYADTLPISTELTLRASGQEEGLSEGSFRKDSRRRYP